MQRREFLRNGLLLGAAGTAGLLGGVANGSSVSDVPKPAVAGDRLVLNVKGIDYPFRWCPAGTFLMGSPPTEKKIPWSRSIRETQHQVSLTRGFWMLETQVTQAMWESVIGSNPSHFKGEKLPVESVSWYDCQKFIEQLNAHLAGTPVPHLAGTPGTGYRFSLPTEAQWEYACRAGTTTPFNFGSVLNGDKANCAGNYPYGTSTKGKDLERTSDVGSYPANAWGLFDMHGNVYEWCSEWRSDWCSWYGPYPGDSVTDPVGPSFGLFRVLRGGSWYSGAEPCRSASRYDYLLSYRSKLFGVRVSLVRVESTEPDA